MIILRNWFYLTLTLLCLGSCSFTCGLHTCRQLSSSFSVQQINGFGACGGAPLSRKLQITCAPASGSNAACTSRSNGSGYYAVLVPNTGGGTFSDSNYSVAQGFGPIADCNTLWNAMNMPTGQRPTDILAIYHGDQTLGDFVTCTDVGGCSVTTTNCFSGWDAANQIPSGTAVGIANGTYLSCAFIDSPYTDGTVAQGAPPTPGLPPGLVGNVVNTQFGSTTVANPTTNPILFNTWVNY